MARSARYAVPSGRVTPDPLSYSLMNIPRVPVAIKGWRGMKGPRIGLSRAIERKCDEEQPQIPHCVRDDNSF